MTAKTVRTKKPAAPSWQETIALILIVILFVGSFGLQIANFISTLKTNELLSTFQHTDTVKEEPTCEPGFVSLDSKCYATIGLVRRHKPAYDPQADPNLCEHIRSECATPPGDGPKKCRQICDLP